MACHVKCDSIGFNVLEYIVRLSVIMARCGKMLRLGHLDHPSCSLKLQTPRNCSVMWCKGTEDLRTEVRRTE